jgi:hypothetical protein
MLQFQSSAAISNDHFIAYRELIINLVSLVQDSGYELLAFRDEQSSKFHTLPPSVQTEIISGLTSFYSVNSGARDGGASLKGDSQEAAWWTIRNLKWRPLSDIFSYVKPGDTLEIYDLQHIQIFRSFNMFKCISYSLDELVTYQWPELYERNERDAKAIMFDVDRAIAEVRTIAGADTTSVDHIVSERFSIRKRSALYQTRAVSPLLSQSGAVVGFLNVICATPLMPPSYEIEQSPYANL